MQGAATQSTREWFSESVCFRLRLNCGSCSCCWTLYLLNGLCLFHETCVHWACGAREIYVSEVCWQVTWGYKLKHYCRSPAWHRANTGRNIVWLTRGHLRSWKLKHRHSCFFRTRCTNKLLSTNSSSGSSVFVLLLTSLLTSSPVFAAHGGAECRWVPLTPSWGWPRPSRGTPTPRRWTWESEPTGMTRGNPLSSAVSARYNCH